MSILNSICLSLIISAVASEHRLFFQFSTDSGKFVSPLICHEGSPLDRATFLTQDQLFRE